MNVCFPKTQNSIPALRQVGIAGFVPVSICLLYGVQISWINGGVAMPEVTIPLNDDSLFWQQNIYNEFAADYLLFRVLNTDAIQDRTPCGFKLVGFLHGWKSQNTIDTLHVFMVIATSMRAILYVSLESPPRHVERVAACFAILNDTAAAGVNRVLSCRFFRLGCFLPSVGAINRAKRNGATTARNKRLSTITTSVGTAVVTSLGKVRSRQEWPTAFVANFRVACNVFHATIIPWSVAICN